MTFRMMRTLFAALALLAGSAANAQATKQQAATSSDEARALAKLPRTVEDHTAMAKEYQEKAEQYRKEAQYHREMAAAYKASHPDMKGGVRNADAVKMEKHCMTIVKDAEKLAADAEWSAKYHAERAKEMQQGR